MPKATTVEQYLADVPADRREALSAIRDTILKNLPEGYEEGIQYGMIGYYVPHSVYPPGYHCDTSQPLPFAGLASQKNYISIYLMSVYGNEENEAWFRQAWTEAGKKLDMGKSCIRVKKLDDVPLDVLGQAIQRVPVKKFISSYESALEGTTGKAARRADGKQKPKAAKKAGAARKPATKKKA
jgi:hypothetical protein